MPATYLCKAPQFFKCIIYMAGIGIARIIGKVVRQNRDSTLKHIFKLSGRRKVKEPRLQSRDESIGSEIPP